VNDLWLEVRLVIISRTERYRCCHLILQIHILMVNKALWLKYHGLVKHYWLMLMCMLLHTRMTRSTPLRISSFVGITVYPAINSVYNIIKSLVIFISSEERFVSHIYGGILLLKRVYYRLQSFDNSILLLNSFFTNSQELLHLEIFILQPL
jgi:hypothetical protein